MSAVLSEPLAFEPVFSVSRLRCQVRRQAAVPQRLLKTMTVLSLPQVKQYEARARRRWLVGGLCALLSIAVVASLVGSAISNQRFHQGTYTDDYSADFDVNRIEYPLPGGAAVNKTAHEIYISFEGRPRITLWEMI